MKKLKNIKELKILSKLEQKNINGGSAVYNCGTICLSNHWCNNSLTTGPCIDCFMPGDNAGFCVQWHSI